MVTHEYGGGPPSLKSQKFSLPRKFISVESDSPRNYISDFSFLLATFVLLISAMSNMYGIPTLC